jgi:hypothetical protein
MRYASAAAFRQALEERFKNEAAATGLGLERLRKRVAFELLLRRLLTSRFSSTGLRFIPLSPLCHRNVLSGVVSRYFDEHDKLRFVEDWCGAMSSRLRDIQSRLPRGL